MLINVNGQIRSDAPTAYELLDDVATLMLAQPKVCYMGDWLKRTVRPILTPYGDCHTIGCIAGWITALTIAEPVQYHHIGFEALNILGVPEIAGLFDGSVSRGGQALPYGHPDYIGLVVDRLRAFQRLHTTLLRAKPVRSPFARVPEPEPEPELVCA